MENLMSPIVDIISLLWPCCARHTSYLCKLQENQISLRTAMSKLKEARDDVQRRVDEEEADLNEPKMCTEQVGGWLVRVQTIEDEVEKMLQKAGEQLSRARCVGGCCPPKKCWSNYKLGKSIAKKIPLLVELKGEGDFQVPICVARPTNYVSKLQDSKNLLSAAMEELKNVKNDVQRKVDEEEADPTEPKMRTEQVRGWLQSVENIEGEVKVIMQTSDELLNNTECREKDKLVVMKMASVDKLKAGKGDFQVLTYRLPLPRVEDINRESPVGMESMFDEVWRLVHDTDDKQPVSNIVGLYGPGGVGKTTLLEEINNEFKNKINSGEYGFDYVVIFVVVSKPVNYVAIQTKIGERLGLKDSLKEDGNESSRAEKIFNALRNKNYVLLLDDIWERVDLQRIGIPIIHPKGNSKLIFTTRSERVCGEMDATHTFQVECLPWDKAWSLFQEKVGEKALNYFSGAHELAKDVARECDGLPLALITIGRAMSTKKSIQEWKDAKTTLQRYAFDFKEMRDKVLPRLKLSYDNLSETEKSCFRYCALYPEDFSIKINTVIDYWIAEGFLDGFDKLDDARNRGHTIIGSLKSACMLESGNKENHVKMHDVIRDLALWIVKDCSSSSSSDESRNNSDNNKYLVVVHKPFKKVEKAERILREWKWAKNTERIFWKWDWNSDTRFKPSSSSSSNNDWSSSSDEEEIPPKLLLTTLILNISFEIRLPPTFFQHMSLLRVLDMSQTPLNDPIPISICELHELRYLKLAGSSGITPPLLLVELRKLVKLKFLILKNFRRIPAGLIANFSELQVLDIRGKNIFEDWELEDGPSFSELDGLEQLQEVRITITTDDIAFDKCLCNRKLQRVWTYLKLTIDPPSPLSRRVLDLSNLKSLKDLHLEVSSICYITQKISRLEELVLYSNVLETLTLLRFVKLNSILWMAATQPRDDHLSRSHLQSLHSIRIVFCHALKDLTWLVYAENLKTLDVQHCRGLETIIEEFGGGTGGDDHGLEEGGAEGGGGGVFRRLETLVLYYLPKLKSICSHALLFPSIERIDIENCPELKKLPLDSRSNVNNTLQKIQGEPNWWSELQWEDETIKSKFLPYYKKPILHIW